jgi:hypothetical protein
MNEDPKVIENTKKHCMHQMRDSFSFFAVTFLLGKMIMMEKPSEKKAMRESKDILISSWKLMEEQMIKNQLKALNPNDSVDNQEENDAEIIAEKMLMRFSKGKYVPPAQLLAIYSESVNDIAKLVSDSIEGVFKVYEE